MEFFKKLFGLKKKEEGVKPMAKSQEMSQPEVTDSLSEAAEVDGVDMEETMADSTDESASESSTDDNQSQM